MIAGTLEIQMLANMARLQADMNNAKRTVNDTVATMNKVLGAIGVGVSLAGVASMVKQVVNAGDKLNDLRKITGLTVNELGGLEKQAKLNGTSLDVVARAVGQMSKQMYNGADAFRALGIEVKGSDGQLRNANAVLLDVANRFSRMEDGATKSAVANQIFGKSGRDLIPMLNEGNQKLLDAVEAHRKYSGWTDKSAEEADLFNDQLLMLEGRLGGVKTRLVTDLLPAMNNILSAFVGGTSRVNEFSFSVNILSPLLKGLAIAGYTVADIFNFVARALGAATAQAIAFAKFDYKNYREIGKELDRLNAESGKSYAKFVDTVLNGDKQIAAQIASGGLKQTRDLQISLPSPIDKTTNAIERQAKAFDMELYKLKQYDQEASRARSITRSLMTEQEMYNETLEELILLKPYLSVDTYTRALEKAQRELNDTGVKNRQVVNEMDQLWIQAGRNIQNALGNMVFDFFNGGLNDMVRNAGNAVLRIMSEFAGLRIAQGLGLTAMFAVPGTAAASGSAGGGFGLGEALSIGSMGTSLLSMYKGGFGSMGMMGSAVGGIGSMLGSSSMAAFGGGLAGDAIGGLAAGGFTSGAASAASMGASFAAVAGPAIALAAVDMIGRALAGDKKLGGAEYIPVLGGFLAAMFGRGPYKFRQQSLQGTFSADGFDGSMTDVYRSKGGWFMGNKHKSIESELSRDMQMLFDDAIGGFYAGARSFAANMGIEADLVEKYTQEIQIKSEKKQRLTEEAITKMIDDFGNSLATHIIPNVEMLRKMGEDAFDAMTRMNNEYVVLVNSATLLLGKSATDARAMISGGTFEGRTGFIDAAGGIDALNQKSQFFAANFLTDAERLVISKSALDDELTKLGLSADLTREQFRGLVQSFGQINGVSEDTLQSLLNLQGAFVGVRNAQDQLAAAEQARLDQLAAAEQARLDQLVASLRTDAGNAFSALQRAADAERKQLSDAYNIELEKQSKAINGFKDSIGGLTGVFNKAQSALGSLNVMGIDVARNQIRAAIAGNSFDSPLLERAIDALTAKPSTGFISLLEQQRYEAENIQLLSDLGYSVDSQLTLEKRTLTALESARDRLTDGFRSEMLRLDGLLDTAKLQLDALNGIDGSVMSVAAALAAFGAALSAARLADPKQPVAIDLSGPGAAIQLSTSNYPVHVTDQVIRDFAASHSAREIYNAAKEYGVSFDRYAQVTGTNVTDLHEWAKANNLASFDVGGKTKRTGLAMLHKDEQVLTRSETTAMETKLGDMKTALEVMTLALNTMERRFRKWDVDGMPEVRTA